MEWPLLTVDLTRAEDIVEVRHRARQVASFAGLDAPSQIRLATSVSEISRNAIAHAGGGRVAFSITRASPAALRVRISDNGPGIRDIEAVLDGRAEGHGIASARRLVDDFAITSTSPGFNEQGGTTVTLSRRLPEGSIASEAEVARIVSAVSNSYAPSPVAELQTQNSELIASLAELRIRQDELLRLNTELEDTNRGVVALYAELDERAEQLRHVSDLKSRFLSNMSHEFRTPLNSILALSRLLLDHTDGPLTPEQERQVSYVRRSAESLTELVNDLLDLAKVEAGKLEVRSRHFTIGELFGALRGVMRPLKQNDAVDLVFDEPAHFPTLFTDEPKVAQILRNLISNALKFTEHGEVRVSAAYDAQTRQCSLVVADTGIGIAAEYQELVFQEFSQVASALQLHAKGTGLGLPLSRQLAELLGGRLSLLSTPDVGSAFTLTLPILFGSGVRDPSAPVEATSAGPVIVSQPAVSPGVLLIDDEETSRYVIRQMLGGCGPLLVHEAASGAEGLRLARSIRPDIVILDVRLPDLDGSDVLDRLRDEPSTATIPVIICTSSVLSAYERARLAHSCAILSKTTLTRDVLRQAMVGHLPVSLREACE